jgi:hypothetical protein
VLLHQHGDDQGGVVLITLNLLVLVVIKTGDGCRMEVNPCLSFTTITTKKKKTKKKSRELSEIW